MSVKLKKHVFAPIVVIFSVFAYVLVAQPAIEKNVWVLSYARQNEPPFFVLAHNDDDYDFSDDVSSPIKFSKPIKLTLEATDGKLILADATNGKTYEGTYVMKHRSRYGRYINQSYSIVIDDVEGTANISSQYSKTLLVSIGDYYLHFEVK